LAVKSMAYWVDIYILSNIAANIFIALPLGGIPSIITLSGPREADAYRIGSKAGTSCEAGISISSMRVR
jgi:hypothetical protein